MYVKQFTFNNWCFISPLLFLNSWDVRKISSYFSETYTIHNFQVMKHKITSKWVSDNCFAYKFVTFVYDESSFSISLVKKKTIDVQICTAWMPLRNHSLHYSGPLQEIEGNLKFVLRHKSLSVFLPSLKMSLERVL